MPEGMPQPTAPTVIGCSAPPGHRAACCVAVLAALVLVLLLFRMAFGGADAELWSVTEIFASMVRRLSKHEVALFYTPAWLLTSLLLYTAVAPMTGHRLPCPGFLAPRAVYVVLILLTVCAWRWPYLACGQLDVDQGMEVGEAMALWRDPLFCRSVDTTTHGVLFIYPLLLARAFGLQFDYGLLHLYGLLLVAASATFGYLFLDRVFGGAPGSPSCPTSYLCPLQAWRRSAGSGAAMPSIRSCSASPSRSFSPLWSCGWPHCRQAPGVPDRLRACFC